MPAPKGHKPYNTRGEGGCPAIHTVEFIEKEAEAFVKWMKVEGNVYFKKFALIRGYHPQRLVEFAQKSKRFSEALDIARAFQEVKLVEGGLSGSFNSGFTKFVMANTCGWTDRVQQVVSGDAQNPLNFVMSTIDGATKDMVKDGE